MTKIFLFFFIFFLSLFMFFLNNPLSMGFLILTQTLLICLLSGMLIKTYWFSYILFLTFMGGLLVLFIYVSSIASNELFNSSIYIKLLLLLLFPITVSLIMYMYMYNLTWMNFSNNSDMNNFYLLNFLINNENNINLNKMYNNQTFMIMLMLIIYLFITLIAVVKITNIFYGPLRSNM